MSDIYIGNKQKIRKEISKLGLSDKELRDLGPTKAEINKLGASKAEIRKIFKEGKKGDSFYGWD